MKKYALIGEKLSHSLSPCIHEAVFGELDLEAGYTLMEILRTPERAASLREQLRQRIELLRLGCAKPAEPAAHSEEETP